MSLRLIPVHTFPKFAVGNRTKNNRSPPIGGFKMISNGLFRIFGYVARFGSTTGFLPWKWDSRRRRLILLTRNDRRFYRIVTWLGIFSRICSTLYLSLTLAFADVKIYETIVTFVFISFVNTTAVIMLVLLLPETQRLFTNLINGILIFNEQQMEFHQMSSKHVPITTAEKFVPGVIGCAMIGIVLSFSSHWSIQSAFTQLYWLLKYVTFPGVGPLIAFGHTVLNVADWYFHDGLICLASMYATFIPNWLEKNIDCEVEVGETQRKKALRVFCRGHQVLRRHIQEFVRYTLPFTFIIGVGSLVTCSYSLIRMYDILPAIIFAVLATGLISISTAFLTGCRKGCTWIKKSEAYNESASNSKTRKYPSVMDKMFCKSVPPGQPYGELVLGSK